MTRHDTAESIWAARPGWLRRRLSRLARRLGLYRFLKRRSGTQSVAFTQAFVALAAKMAAADGVAVKVEADAFERFLEPDPADVVRIRQVYDLAKTDTAGFETYATRIAYALKAEPDIKRNVFESLMYVACADGVLHPAEDNFLKTVAGIFSYSSAEYRRIKALFVHDPDSPYAILELDAGASAAEVRARYRKLVQVHHPDRLIAQGAPAAVVKAATAKLAAINAAYEAIEAERTRGGPAR